MFKKMSSVFMVALTIINLSACSKVSTNPKEASSILDINYLNTSNVVVEENGEIDTLSIKDKGAVDSYIDSIKTSKGYETYLNIETNKVNMVYKNGSLFPSQMTIENDSITLNVNILNYNETEKTFDISFKEGDIETAYFENIKIKNELDVSNLENLDNESSYRIKTMLTSYMVYNSIAEHVNENPTPRAWWITLIFVVVWGFITGGSGYIRI